MTAWRLAAIALALALVACAQGRPFDPPRAGEIPDGPGLLSGEDGKFILYRR